MSDTTKGFDQIEEEFLGLDVSDEALETAATSEQANFTLGACTGLSQCGG